jgi:hypothetical protein
MQSDTQRTVAGGSDSLGELRDRLAELCGWAYDAACEDWERGDDVAYPHPFPPGDLTALAAAWPEGWWWSRLEHMRDGVVWLAGQDLVSVRECDTGDEYADRLRLTVAVLEHEALAPAPDPG